MSSDDEIESFLKKQQNIPIVFITNSERRNSSAAGKEHCPLYRQFFDGNSWSSECRIFPASRLRGDLHAPRGVPEAVLQAFSEYFQFAEARWGECCV
ncbi:Myotubularin phosphatase domain-containing protein [Caenorhabditis elegans]|uniref:Myotubularin phosphatase domain-containing protein n=1 Tax=Caenorhabditis elegans TaxID=6239 RepID=B5D5N5_CAEEL|nr:Myotubularin phosphatase domain-containing protein [Caenorhabditis elegans]CCD73882.1 Myotubularin phosphatase domain-containing protein [Caenorhabditis elegans]|eukprot:NP_001129843.1 Uncharacterized protein CELE_Y71H2AM.6 [Caenorhabditis elegans]